MADYELSKKADQDLTELYIFSFQRFGEDKADAYLLSLEEFFRNRVETPHLGRDISYIRQGYFRYEHVRHSIFYKLKEDEIIVMRVLHNSMNIEQHI